MNLFKSYLPFYLLALFPCILQGNNPGITFPASPSSHNLPTLDFEGVVDAAKLRTCATEVDAASDDSCFDPSDIPVGVTFKTDRGRLALLGDIIGTTGTLSSKKCNANLEIALTEQINFVEFHIQSIRQNGMIEVKVLDQDDNLEYTSTIEITPSQQLLQIQVICEIGRIELNDISNSIHQTIDNFRFGFVPIDDIPPTAICPANIMMNTDAEQCGAIVSFQADVSDNCDNPTLSLSHQSGDFFPTGITTVTATATDAANNTDQCSFTITVTDNEAPTASCPSNISVPTDVDACGAIVSFQVEGTDNCGHVTPSLSQESGSFFSVGTTPVTAIVTDAANNTDQCTFTITVTDTQAPAPVCLTTTVDFNGEDQMSVLIADLYDAANSTDNCGSVYLVTPTEDPIISCAQIGEMVPVTIQVNDDNGNTNSCTATIIVEGLPCGFSNPGGIGCAGDNIHAYEAATGTFTLASDGCTPVQPNVEDSQSIITRELCGDGYVKAYVSTVSPDGFAGIFIRNSTDLGAKKVEIGSNNVNRIMKGVRTVDNYPAYPQPIMSFDKFWLKIERFGSSFRALASVDDVTYVPYIHQTIFMDDCLQVGLFVHSTNDAMVLADFRHVEIHNNTSAIIHTGQSTTTLRGTAVDQQQEQGDTEAPTTTNTAALKVAEVDELITDIKLFPNPARDEVQLVLGQLPTTPIEINLHNMQGQLIKRIQLDEPTAVEQPIDISTLTPGTYIVHIKHQFGQQAIKLIKT